MTTYQPSFTQEELDIVIWALNLNASNELATVYQSGSKIARKRAKAIIKVEDRLRELRAF